MLTRELHNFITSFQIRQTNRTFLITWSFCSVFFVPASCYSIRVFFLDNLRQIEKRVLDSNELRLALVADADDKGYTEEEDLENIVIWKWFQHFGVWWIAWFRYVSALLYMKSDRKSEWAWKWIVIGRWNIFLHQTASVVLYDPLERETKIRAFLWSASRMSILSYN